MLGPLGLQGGLETCAVELVGLCARTTTSMGGEVLAEQFAHVQQPKSGSGVFGRLQVEGCCNAQKTMLWSPLV